MEKIILTTIFVFLLSFINSLFSYFLDYCFWEGSIFGKWLPFLAKQNLKIFKPKQLEELNQFKGSKDYDNMLIDRANQLAFFKILGGCIICSNIYIGTASFTLIHHILHTHWLYIIPYLLFSSFVLRKIAK